MPQVTQRLRITARHLQWEGAAGLGTETQAWGACGGTPSDSSDPAVVSTSPYTANCPRHTPDKPDRVSSSRGLPEPDRDFRLEPSYSPSHQPDSLTGPGQGHRLALWLILATRKNCKSYFSIITDFQDYCETVENLECQTCECQHFLRIIKGVENAPPKL